MEYTKYTPTKEYLEHYFESILSPENSYTYNLHTKRAFDYFCNSLGAKALGEVSPTDIIDFINELKSLGYSSSYAQVLYMCCRAAFEYSYRQGIIERNPFDLLTPPFKPRSKLEPFAYTEEEIKAIFNASETFPVTKNIIKLMFYTGIKPCELLALTWDCVDLEGRKLLINKHFKTIGKHNRGNTVALPGSANKLCRSIPLPALAIDCLQDQKLFQEENKITFGTRYKNTEDYVFTLPRGDFITPNYLKRNMEDIQHISNVKNFNSHNIRHHYALTASKANIDMNTIRVGLGIKHPRPVIQYWASAHDTQNNALNN